MATYRKTLARLSGPLPYTGIQPSSCYAQEGSHEGLPAMHRKSYSNIHLDQVSDNQSTFYKEPSQAESRGEAKIRDRKVSA